MRKLALLLLFSALITTIHAQYWQQEVNYKIDVSLDDKNHELTGFESIQYINHSPDTLRFIWFHLWPNAYKNDRTAMTDQMIGNGNTKFYFSSKEDKGYINRLDFKIDNTTALTEDHPNYIDVIKILLPKPLAPGETVHITTPFHVRLPYNFSRGGHDGQSYQVTQWYPKPAVYDHKGWHPMPYLDQGEFYSEFGNYDVNITVPSNYVVAATGELQTTDEKNWLTQKSIESKSTLLTLNKETTRNKEWLKKVNAFPASASTQKTIQYTQSHVHDFAWFADKRFLVNMDTLQIGSNIIHVASYYTPAYSGDWLYATAFAKDGLRFYSNQVGNYPYNVATVVQGPESFGGGMEYPTITVISPGGNKQSLDGTIAHELGHNWFYGILGSNERDHPWMDEGMNSFYERRYTSSKYGKGNAGDQILFETKAATHSDQPISTSSEKFTEFNYYNTAYYKTDAWLQYVESQMGTAAFDAAMQSYFQQWKFKHPYPEDFRKALESSTGKDLSEAFSYFDKKGTLPNQQRKGTRTIFILQPSAIKAYLQQPSKNILAIGPALGMNAYDKLMAGVFLTNMKLPPSNLQFFGAGMYATGTKRFSYFGTAFYTHYIDGLIKKIDLGFNAASFTMDEFTPLDKPKLYFAVNKFVPGVRITLGEKDPRSHRVRYLQFKSFLINEENLRFYRDTIISGLDTTISFRPGKINTNRTLQQLSLVVENNRVLYPYRGELRAEAGKDFARLSFTGNYFFNYPKEGGLDVRLFGGKFIYTNSKTITKQFETDRYHLNLTGPNGYEDYAYADYFVGRNKFEGFLSQQLMIRDGAFKVRTDLLADKVGKTDDWLIATNLSSTIPSGLNPLSVLPVKIPLKVFVDIGTYAETWKENAESDRFLFDAGLQIPLFFETVNLYIPVVYSGVFKDYIQSTIPKKGRLWKTVSFSIDISRFNFRKISSGLSF